ncbi:hypothetical protein E2C01_046190 [Portunus trituberculatus]|uniref:Uncharacterized protein n=1 Tax=Portunus trituberculatus TaxID=210409 RepID=A0A5B7G4E1_PORTR|nr:hypothetical protein [Portunus trituberculatus]
MIGKWLGTVRSMGGISKPPHLANLSLAKFSFGGRVATDHRVHAWRFEFQLGGLLASARRTTRLPGDRGNEFWRFTANVASTSATGVPVGVARLLKVCERPLVIRPCGLYTVSRSNLLAVCKQSEIPRTVKCSVFTGWFNSEVGQHRLAIGPVVSKHCIMMY